MVDASDPTYEARLEVSRGVLREIGADAVPFRLVLAVNGLTAFRRKDRKLSNLRAVKSAEPNAESPLRWRRSASRGGRLKSVELPMSGG